LADTGAGEIKFKIAKELFPNRQQAARASLLQ
jgi:hypothetical protein